MQMTFDEADTMKRLRYVLALSAAAVVWAAAAGAYAGPDVPASAYAEGAVDGDNPRVETRLLVDATQVKAGDRLRVGVLYTLDPGWHIYWRNSGDAGLGTDTRLSADQADIGELMWPAPHVFEEEAGDIHTFGYSDTVLFMADATVHADAAGALTVRASVDYLACKVGCLPGHATLEQPVVLAETTEPAAAAVGRRFDQAAGRVPREAADLDIGVQSAYSPSPIRPGERFRAAIALDYCPARRPDCTQYTVAFDKREYAFIPDRTTQVSLEVVDVWRHPGVEHGQILELQGTASAQDPRDGERLSGVIYLERDDGQMMPILVDQPIPRGSADAQSAPVDSPLLQAARPAGDATGRDPDAEPTSPTNPTNPANPASPTSPAPMALWKALGLAFLGGMILNLMPCVFPVLAIKVSSFTRLVHESKADIVSHGLAYTAGIVGSLLALAAVVIGLRAAGTQVGWGFQFQQPGYIVGLCAILVVFALNLFGVFEVSVAPNELADKTRQASGLRRSFGEGVLAVILATPCSAPFLGAAVGFALTSNAATTLGIFAMLGLGLAAPFVVLTLAPGWAKVLPKPGGWMVGLKKVLGFALLGTVIWLCWILVQMTGSAGIVETLIFLGALAMGVWVFGRFQYRLEGILKWALTAVVATAVAAVGWGVLDLDLVADPVAEADTDSDQAIEWQTWTDQAVQAELDAGRTVFVDFTADWCITCKVNERTIIRSAKVQRLLGRDDVATFEADWTNPDEKIRQKLADFGRGGVPMYLVYHPDRPDQPDLLPEVLTIDLVVDALALE